MRLLRSLILFAASLLPVFALAQHNGTLASNANSGTGTITFAAGRFGNAANFGNSSAYFNGYVIPGVTEAAQTAIASTGGWTMEGVFLSSGGHSTGQISMELGGGDNGNFWFGCIANGESWLNYPDGTHDVLSKELCDNQPHAQELQYDGTTVRARIDGVTVTTRTATGIVISGAANLGWGHFGQFTWRGWGDEVRFSKGIRYSADYTPATQAFTSDANTIALYHLESDATDSGTGGSGTPSSFTIAPTTFPLGVATSFTMTNSGTDWTTSTLPTVTGGTNAYFSSLLVSGQTISGTLLPGTVAGTLTIGNNTNSATATATGTVNVRNQIVYVGDSLTDGYGLSTRGTLQMSRPATALTSLGPTWKGVMTAVSGQKVTQMTAQLGSQINALYDATLNSNVLIMAGCHNDYVQDNVTAQQCVSRLTAFATAAHAAHPGWTLVICTELPTRGFGPSPWPQTFNSTRRASNAIIRSTYKAMGYDKLEDFGGDGLMGQDGEETNLAYFQTDNVHLTEAGEARWGSYDAATILAPTIAGGVRSNLAF